MLLLLKFLIKYKFLPLMWKGRKQYIKLWHAWLTDPWPVLAKGLPPYLCLSVPLKLRTRNVHKQHKSCVMSGHSAATTKLHSSPGLPLTLYEATPNTLLQPLLLLTPTHRLLYFLAQAQPPGLVGTGTGRPGGTGHLVLEERQGGWTKRKGPNFFLHCSWASAHTIIAYCIMTHA